MKISGSTRIRKMTYAIRDVVEHARILERKGEEIIRLNIGDPIKFDFETPAHIREAFIRAISAGESGYSDSEGIPELREAVSRRERKKGVDIPADMVVATAGVTEGLQMVLAASLDSSSEILVPGPSYPADIEYAKLFGANPVSYRKLEDDGWRPDIDDIREKIGPKTKCMIVCSPNNPTGAVYPKSDLREIMDVAGENGIFVISDEIYDLIALDDTVESPASINHDVPVVVLNGLSKVYLAPGWRVGYVAFRDPSGALSEIWEGVLKQARARLCANTVAQYGLAAALDGPHDHVDQMLRKLRPRRDLATRRINQMWGLSVTEPRGAFYMFPSLEPCVEMDDKAFVLDVLEKTHVLLVHGSGFDPVYGTDHFRLVFLPPLDVLEDALDRLETYMEGLSRRRA